MTAGDGGRRLIERVRFNDDGLVPAVVQDAGDGRVLTLAWMNRESLERTLERGETWFWSRSRQELWHKGATSGNTQAVRVGGPRLRRRRGAGAASTRPAWPATPARATCFHDRPRRRGAGRAVRRPRRPRAHRSPSAPPRPTPRRRTPPGCWPRASTRCARRWARRRPRSPSPPRAREHDQVVYESADLLFHLAVLWRASGVSLDEVAAELASRRAPGMTRLRLEAPAGRSGAARGRAEPRRGARDGGRARPGAAGRTPTSPTARRRSAPS